jgi:hypothetical protein
LSKERKRKALKELEDAYTELANNLEYQAETRLWEMAE